MPANPTVFTIKDRKQRQCRKCHRNLAPRELIRRIDHKLRRQQTAKCAYLCQNCYVDAHGEPIL